jgi:hydroxymethylglutaryl-CoA lyase
LKAAKEKEQNSPLYYNLLTEIGMNKKIKITECPRDAMQGIEKFIPTHLKAKYINALLKVGYDTIDFGSFVSPKYIPQMSDTEEVLKLLNLSNTNTKLLVIVANKRGAEQALKHPEINYIGFPFSVSETFQKKNTNKSISEALELVGELFELTKNKQRHLVVYLSMAFGNPYGEAWNIEIVKSWVKKLSDLGVGNIALSDTIGVSNKESISLLFNTLTKEFPHIEFGAHLHSRIETWREKVMAAYDAGCTKFDSAIRGLGGCPMAKDELIGNLPTEKVLTYMTEKRANTGLNPLSFESAYNVALTIFN